MKRKSELTPELLQSLRGKEVTIDGSVRRITGIVSGYEFSERGFPYLFLQLWRNEDLIYSVTTQGTEEKRFPVHATQIECEGKVYA